MRSLSTVREAVKRDAQRKLMLRTAMRFAAQWEREYERYLARCDADRRAGHRPHYCEHGTDQWTEYDNICGACEDGHTMADGVYRRTVAIAEAKAAIEKRDRILEAMRVITFEAGVSLPDGVRDDILFATAYVMGHNVH